MQHSDCRPALRVKVNTPDNARFHGRTGTIQKVNPKNVLVDLDDSTRPLSVHPCFLEAAGTSTPPVPLVPFTVEDIVLPPAVGTIVQHTGNHASIQGPHVVIGESTSHGHAMVRIAKLGGDNNRYWKVSPKNITVVEHWNLEEL